MPGTAGLDAPGVLHHVMIRRIERRKIFRNDKDREDFIERLDVLCPETGTACYAWAFMSNMPTCFSVPGWSRYPDSWHASSRGMLLDL